MILFSITILTIPLSYFCSPSKRDMHYFYLALPEFIQPGDHSFQPKHFALCPVFWHMPCAINDLMNEMKACDHLPTHLGRGALHTRRPPPRQVSLLAPSRRYPGKQEKIKGSPTPKWKPIRLLKAGTPGSSHGSRSYSENNKTSYLNKWDKK